VIAETSSGARALDSIRLDPGAVVVYDVTPINGLSGSRGNILPQDGIGSKEKGT
jgi:hypothetical protein